MDSRTRSIRRCLAVVLALLLAAGLLTLPRPELAAAASGTMSPDDATSRVANRDKAPPPPESKIEPALLKRADAGKSVRYLVSFTGRADLDFPEKGGEVHLGTTLLERDVDGNGSGVNFADFGPFAEAYGTDDDQADLNEDGVVDFIDFGLISDNWNVRP